uniref:hypothetical protein n=1 Tax=Prevotella sp. TaxID=59823 RepID=UPI00402A3133
MVLSTRRVRRRSMSGTSPNACLIEASASETKRGCPGSIQRLTCSSLNSADWKA